MIAWILEQDGVYKDWQKNANSPPKLAVSDFYYPTCQADDGRTYKCGACLTLSQRLLQEAECIKRSLIP